MPAESQPALRKKTIHQLDTTFSGTPWPEISAADQEEILELLCSLLHPIGQHRRDHVKVSKGKRAAKRARSRAKTNGIDPLDAPPPAPELGGMVDVGLSRITRSLAANTASSLAQSAARSEGSAQDSQQDTTTSPYAMVFVARGDQTSTFNCHFPKMVAASCAKLEVDDRTRLVGFSKASSERLSRCLNVARVSSIAVRRDAPGTGPLWNFVKQRVQPIEAPWLVAEASDCYKGAKINSTETTVGPKKIRLS